MQTVGITNEGDLEPQYPILVVQLPTSITTAPVSTLTLLEVIDKNTI